MKSVVLLLLTCISVINCSRILIVFPMAAPSHYILGNAYARGLAEAGHDVTMVSAFEEKKPPKNGKYRDVVLTGFLELKKNFSINLIDLEHMNPFFNIPFMNSVGNDITLNTLQHPNFQKLIKSNEHFDAVVIEQFNNDALKALAYHFNAPLILFSTIGANAWVNPLVGNPSPLSYIPDTFLSYTTKMTFCERLVNWLFFVVSELNRQYIFFPRQNEMMKETFPNVPDLSVLNYNASIVLVNSHESTNNPAPYVPNMINIGGFHIAPPKELPKEFKTFMDNAKEGVVYFSMGSNIQSSMLSKEKKQIILNALGKLKQKVLWKWDEEDFTGKPANIRLGKWFPQQDLLAHPNTKLFITHGGLLSTTETVYHGVPILALPIFGDQKMNAARAVTNGIGISLSFSDLTEEKLSDALKKLLNDPKYLNAAKTRSILMHDRPVKPLDLAVYWTEFVIRHRGASHLRVAALDLTWYQYLLLDVISFVALVSISSIVILYLIVRRICCSTKKKQEKVKKN